MEDLIKKLKINESYTKKLKKPRWFNRIKDNIPKIEDYNFMADVLMLPKTKTGFRYLLVVVDIASDEFDIEPLKTKSPIETLSALKTMFKRKYIKKPYASIRTDGGTEFQGVFHKYLYDHSILHRVAEPARHKQLANVENLNRTLGRLFNGYMNAKEEETMKQYKEWDDIIDTVRTDLNKIRKKVLGDHMKVEYKVPKFEIAPKYKVGDIVYRITETPRDALGNKQNTSSFRMGDYRFELVPKKIEKVVYYSGENPYRYILEGHSNVSYAEHELTKAKEQNEKYEIRDIIGKKKENNRILYLIWWKGYTKKQATYVSRKSLIDDGLKWLIDNYEKK
jgi:hypothetical protein